MIIYEKTVCKGRMRHKVSAPGTKPRIPNGTSGGLKGIQGLTV